MSKMSYQAQDVPSKRQRATDLLKIMQVPSIHPMLVDHVVADVFSHLEPQELLPCREVCRDWFRAATELYIERQSPRSFSFKDKFMSSCQRQVVATPSTFYKRLQKFMEIMRKSEYIPTSRFRFNCQYFRQDIIPLYSKFLTDYSSTITVLILEGYFQVPLKFPKSYLPNLQMPNLKQLTAKCILKTAPIIETFVKIIETLLRAAVNLETFELLAPYLWFVTDDKKYLPATAATRSLSPNLKKLYMHLPMKNENLDALTHKGLSLDELKFDFGQEKLFLERILVFLLTQAGSLTSIYMKFGHCPLGPQTLFPEMINVKKFQVDGINKCLLGLRMFPNLEELHLKHLTQITDEKRSRIFPEEYRSPKVKNLRTGCIERSTILSTIHCFPLVQKLEYKIDKNDTTGEGLKIVFETMRNLTELHIYVGKKSPFFFPEVLEFDSIFTGISKNTCKEIQRDKSYDQVYEQSQPNITNLPNLKKLSIAQEFKRARFMTDVSIYFGLMKLNNLEKFTTNQLGMTTDGLTALKSKCQVRQY